MVLFTSMNGLYVYSDLCPDVQFVFAICSSIQYIDTNSRTFFFLSDISIFTSIMPFMTLSAVEGIPHATYFCVEFDPHLYIYSVALSAQELLPADYMQYVNRIANQQQPFLCVYLSVAIGLGEVDEVSYTNSNQRTHTRTHTHMDVL